MDLQQVRKYVLPREFSEVMTCFLNSDNILFSTRKSVFYIYFILGFD